MLSRVSLTAITAAVALVTAAVGLIFDLWPSLRPDPRSEFQAEVRVVTVDRGVSYRAFLARTLIGDFDRALREAKAAGVFLDDPGSLVYVETTLRGFKRRTTKLRWSVYDAATRRRVALPDLSDVFGAVESGEAPADRSVQRLWIYPLPERRKLYFVRIELYTDNEETLLALDDSEPIPGVPPATK
jgi:hypothetical protein